jgi:hypothetical protein
VYALVVAAATHGYDSEVMKVEKSKAFEASRMKLEDSLKQMQMRCDD